MSGPQKDNFDDDNRARIEAASRSRWERIKAWTRDLFGNHYGKIGVAVGLLTCIFTYVVAPAFFVSIITAFAPIMLPLLVATVITSVIASVAYAVGKVLTDDKREGATRGDVEIAIIEHEGSLHNHGGDEINQQEFNPVNQPPLFESEPFKEPENLANNSNVPSATAAN